MGGGNGSGAEILSIEVLVFVIAQNFLVQALLRLPAQIVVDARKNYDQLVAEVEGLRDECRIIRGLSALHLPKHESHLSEFVLALRHQDVLEYARALSVDGRHHGCLVLAFEIAFLKSPVVTVTNGKRVVELLAVHHLYNGGKLVRPDEAEERRHDALLGEVKVFDLLSRNLSRLQHAQKKGSVLTRHFSRPRALNGLLDEPGIHLAMFRMIQTILDHPLRTVVDVVQKALTKGADVSSVEFGNH